jgi:hypothetical protein
MQYSLYIVCHILKLLLKGLGGWGAQEPIISFNKKKKKSIVLNFISDIKDKQK